MEASALTHANPESMTDREIMVEILHRLRAYEATVRGIVEAAKNNPSVAMILRANGITL